MAITKVGIVYSKAQQVVRRIIKLHIGSGEEPNKPLPRHVIDAMDEEKEWRHHTSCLHPNEAWAEIPIPVYDSFTEHQHIHDHLGLTGISAVTDKCMVVNENGIVIAVGCWDPWIDKHPGGRIIPSVDAEVGGTFINGVYNRPQSLVIYSPAYRKLIAV